MREYLQSVIEEQESTNEELKSANEEILSANEELQSTNEEQQTAKEEAQSSNEELATVNEELQHRNADLARANDDLINLLPGQGWPCRAPVPDKARSGHGIALPSSPRPRPRRPVHTVPTPVGRPRVVLPRLAWRRRGVFQQQAPCPGLLGKDAVARVY